MMRKSSEVTQKHACLGLLFLAVCAVVAHCPSSASADISPGDVMWAKAAVGPGTDGAQSTAVLQDGSVLMMGTYENTITIGAGEMGETTLPSLGRRPFLAHYKADGSFLGAAPVAGPSNWKHRVVALADGGFVVAGDFNSEATFGDTTLLCRGDRDMYIVRYGANHQPLWAKRAGRKYTSGGGYVATQVERLVAFPDGRCVVAGFFATNATFGLGESRETTLYCGDIDGFVACYQPDGSLDWATAVASYGRVEGLALMPDGGCVVTGRHMYLRNVFITRLLSDGTEAWTKSPIVEDIPGSPYPEEARGWDIAAFSDGSCFVTGNFTGNIIFGSGEANETMIRTGGGFFAKYNLDGTLAWVKRPEAGGESIVPLTDGMLLSSTFGAVSKVNMDGSRLWRRDGGVGTVRGVAVLPDGGGYALVGHFKGTASFTRADGSGITLQGIDDGQEDIYLATFHDPSVILAAPFGPVPPPVTPPASGPEFISEEFRVASDGWSGIYALNYATAEDHWTGSVFGEYAFPTSLPLGEWIGLSIYDLEAGTWEEGVYLFKEEW